ncbi:E3 ubiquitin ligase family protein [Amycolatopsis cihanbeyliensis]|uniref:RING-type E3 ubiquitin transferase n=1 Tax=Amycolatopsis cihanbeyliensis TaxID=1128664 RepID=A0A542DJ31_AMYCI|nr:E3 ubiquitin ligase family protein [Amycolatopsis cihanbeyliensis]TQJ03093.1 E3 ubiquitin ligase [Amycolatopsis cihanbeyliensis]
MWIVGVLLVVAAVAGFFFMRHTKSELHAMIGTETLTIPQLEDLRKVSDELGASGGFRKVAEVVGAAHPRPEGLLTSEVSKTECVWYRYRIDRQYETVEYRDGKRYRRKRTEKVAEHTSHEGYALIDEQGRTIGVDPNGTGPDGTEQTVNRFEPHHGGSGSVEVFGFRLPDFVTGGNNGSTIGFDYKEWVIRPGRRLYVLGEVHDRIGPLVIAKPEGEGHFIVSTRTEEELRDDRVTRHRFLAVGVIVATLAGLALIVADLIG